MAKALLGHVRGPDQRMAAELRRLRRLVGDLEAQLTRLRQPGVTPLAPPGTTVPPAPSGPAASPGPSGPAASPGPPGPATPPEPRKPSA